MFNEKHYEPDVQKLFEREQGKAAAQSSYFCMLLMTKLENKIVINMDRCRAVV